MGLVPELHEIEKTDSQDRVNLRKKILEGGETHVMMSAIEKNQILKQMLDKKTNVLNR